jgi:hypothetical protein
VLITFFEGPIFYSKIHKRWLKRGRIFTL